ncbi:MAG: hypothetical protein H6719_23875 [Sandaracinaceae bacterium]|nr:hypothetical protein [Sandaracinaceae bacterium]
MRLALALALLVGGCGPGAPRATASLRERLTSDEAAAARERAPDLIARVEHAMDRADAAERAGDEAGAADHTTEARLFLEAALAEAARVEDEDERANLEQQVATLLARARRDEEARETIDRGLARADAAAAARAEALAALALAETDEARPARRARVSLEQAADLRHAAAALRARARLTLAAARALGADEAALADSNAALAASEAATGDPQAALAAADRAHHAALRALGAQRAGLDGPGPDGAASLAEAAAAEGFEVVPLPEGTGVEVDDVFAGAATAVSRAATTRVERLATLVAAYPHGPVQVQAQVAQQGHAGDALAERRAEALRRALIAAGADADRLSAQAIPTALRGDEPIARVRLVFVAYAR